MEDHDLKRCYNLLDPATVLEPGSPLYVDIDAYGSPDQRPRGISLCERLTKKFRSEQRGVVGRAPARP